MILFPLSEKAKLAFRSWFWIYLRRLGDAYFPESNAATFCEIAWRALHSTPPAEWLSKIDVKVLGLMEESVGWPRADGSGPPKWMSKDEAKRWFS